MSKCLTVRFQLIIRIIFAIVASTSNCFALAPSSKTQDVSEALRAEVTALSEIDFTNLQNVLKDQIHQITSLSSEEKAGLIERLPGYLKAIGHLDPKLEIPVLVDLTSFFEKDTETRSSELRDHLASIRAARLVLLLGHFQQAWWFYGLIKNLDPSLAQKVYFMNNLSDIPSAFRSIVEIPIASSPLVPMSLWDSFHEKISVSLGLTSSPDKFRLLVYLGDEQIAEDPDEISIYASGSAMVMGAFIPKNPYKGYGVNRIALRMLRLQFPKRKLFFGGIIPGHEDFLLQSLDNGLVDGGPPGMDALTFREKLQVAITQREPAQRTTIVSKHKSIFVPPPLGVMRVDRVSTETTSSAL